MNLVIIYTPNIAVVLDSAYIHIYIYIHMHIHIHIYVYVCIYTLQDDIGNSVGLHLIRPPSAPESLRRSRASGKHRT